MIEVSQLLCLTLAMVLAEAADTGTSAISGWTETSALTVIAAVCISLLLVVFIISLCGGCTPMEVGSDQHAASGSHKTYNQYNSVVTDVNTQVMSAGTSLPNDPYRPNEQSLPYALHPQTAQTFTGYQAQEPYQNPRQGYQSPGSRPSAGAHRHFDESPPPAYSEAVHSGGTQQGQGQPSAPAQPYGW